MKFAIRSSVPCNGCTACCQNDLLILHPEMGDDASQYETMQVTHPLTGKPAIALAHKPGGGCIYLGAAGCTIHDRAPAICREFDCRRFLKGLLADTTRSERRRMIRQNIVGKEVFAAARKRLHTLPDDVA